MLFRRKADGPATDGPVAVGPEMDHPAAHGPAEAGPKTICLVGPNLAIRRRVGIWHHSRRFFLSQECLKKSTIRPSLAEF